MKDDRERSHWTDKLFPVALRFAGDVRQEVREQALNVIDSLGRVVVCHDANPFSAQPINCPPDRKPRGGGHVLDRTRSQRRKSRPSVR